MREKAISSVILCLLLLGLLLSGCSEKTLSNAELWQAAMTDAVFSEDGEHLNLASVLCQQQEIAYQFFVDEEKQP